MMAGSAKHRRNPNDAIIVYSAPSSGNDK